MDFGSDCANGATALTAAPTCPSTSVETSSATTNLSITTDEISTSISEAQQSVSTPGPGQVDEGEKPDEPNYALIAGIVGGLIAIVVLAAVIAVVVKRRRAKIAGASDADMRESGDFGMNWVGMVVKHESDKTPQPVAMSSNKQYAQRPVGKSGDHYASAGL